ncbi:hypothetical protein O6P37_26940 [Mycobacterium sp. CPCC 205372]|uniref:Lipoprotein n=1 Tax=Mycobacterium hippophais TaxID=3016340 RepID=A0ABT4Q0Y1_9MYCO|nr:hypothetical protein [Mycobacterium hippophais]
MLPVLAMLTGCSATVTGEAGRDPDAPAWVTLDAGNYSTAPRPPLGAAGSNGAIIEAHRMADAVVGPWEVDPTLQNRGTASTSVWRSTEAMGTSLPQNISTIAATRGFLTGFSTDRSSNAAPGSLTALQIAVMRFPSAEAATAAAAEMARAPQGPPGATDPPPLLPVVGHAESLAVPSTAGDGSATVAAYTPRGMFVLYTFARAQDGNADTVTRLTTTALSLQKPRLDAFEPTPADRFAALPVDPDGVQVKTIPPAPGTLMVTHGWWPARGVLHFSVDPLSSSALFADAGVVGVANGLVTVTQTRDAAGSSILMKGFADAAARRPEPRSVETDPVPGLATSKCFDGGEAASGAPKIGAPRFVCRFNVDRYVAEVASQQLPDAHQRAAAQYLLLTT